MVPTLFGSAARSLFGIYSPAVGGRQHRAVVICPPLLQEYLRSHRTCRLLADQLAGNGADAFRFDYAGTGDSSGESDEVSLEGAIEDARIAVEEVRDLSGVRMVTLVGLRVGAAVASRAAAGSPHVDRLVLWDPVSDGAVLVNELSESATPMVGGYGETEVGGFPFTRALKAELRSLDQTWFDAPPRHVLMTVSEDLESHRALARRLEAAGSNVDYRLHTGPRCWAELGNLGVGAVPAAILQAIAAWSP